MGAGSTSLAIIGLGSRGLSVLERVVSLASSPVRVELVDPSCAGAGVHAVDQPDYLLLNTTAAQVSMFPDSFSVGTSPVLSGPSLYEWVVARGLRLALDGFTLSPEGVREIRPCEFLPRRVLGEYLGWFLEELLRRAPSFVSVTLHRSSAVDIVDGPSGSLVVVLDDGRRLPVEHAVIATGYTGSVPVVVPPRLVAEPYPLPARLDVIGPGESVAVAGFGLSAMDVISCLTVGRGGRFSSDGRYHASGREPSLLMYSRTGVPCRARPKVVEFGPPYQPLVFTKAAIDALRLSRGGPLDWAEDVMPLIYTEMRIAYRRCALRLSGVGEAAFVARLTRMVRTASLSDVLDSYDALSGDAFDPRAAFDGGGDMLLDDASAYQKWLTDALSRDLADGLLGFTGSPVKAGLDVLRALRDTFRYVVDFGGLTEASLDHFMRYVVPAVNRAVVGPQYERHTELLALIEAGVLSAPFGPAPSVTWDEPAGRWSIASTSLVTPYVGAADWLVNAHVPLPAADASTSPLIAALYASGRIRRHRPASPYVPGVDIDADQHPIGASGEPDPRLYVLGVLCEGAVFYNNLVPSPGAFSRPIFDADRAARAILQGGAPY